MQCLEQRKFPLAELRLLASARSVGKTMKFRGMNLCVQELTDLSLEGVDIALFSAGGAQSKRFAPVAVRAGAVVVDVGANWGYFSLVAASRVGQTGRVVSVPSAGTCTYQAAPSPLANDFPSALKAM